MTHSAIKVLLVDDDHAHLELMLIKIQQHHPDYRIETAASLQQAREILNREIPDIILTDMRLPDGRGIDLLNDFEQIPCPVVMITAFGDIEQAVDAMKKGITDYVIKSEVFWDDLPHVLTRNLNQWQLKVQHEKSRKALSESEEKYRLLIENSLQGIAIFANGRVQFCNQTGLDILQYDFERLQSLSLRGLLKQIFASDRPVFLNAMKQNRAHKKIVQNFEMRILGSRKQMKRLQITSNSIVYESMPAIELFFLDVTEEYRLKETVREREEEIKRNEKQLMQVQRLETIGRLAGGIAHDFNNILAPMAVYLDMAMDDIDSESQTASDLKHVEKGIGRARDLVQQILTFSRQEEQEKLAVDVALLTAEALDLFQATLPNSVSFERRLDQNTGRILAVPTQIHQVIMNLCTNASQAIGRNDGIIEVCLEAVDMDDARIHQHPNLHEGRFARLIVKDNGGGMDTHIQERIFEPFFSTKEVGQNVGLGLAVVHGIVMSHDGAIFVTSEKGRGTTFDVILPLIDSEQIETHVNPCEASRGDEYLLIVDDEEENAEMARDMLKRLGYRVSICTDSRQALKTLQQAKPVFDCLITDFAMPGLNGLELAEAARKMHPQLPVIVMSGFADQQIEAQCQTMQINALLRKPVPRMELCEALRKILNQKR